jgi:hypothetical protein
MRQCCVFLGGLTKLNNTGAKNGCMSSEVHGIARF